MKIIHMMGGGDVGGAKTHIMSLVQALSKEHDIKLISFREGPFPKEASEVGIDVTVLAGQNLFKVRRQLLKIIDDMKPEIIHCHGSRANLMGALVRAKRKIPVITTVHSDYRLDYLGNPLKQYTFGVVNAIALRFLDFYQPVADRMARTLIMRGFNPEKMMTIYNGMDFGEPVGAFDRTAYCKENWGVNITDDNVLCGIAARLTAVKDIGTTVKAFAKAASVQPELRLFIAGTGEDMEKLKKLVYDLQISDKVIFCGWVSPVDNFFAAMDINLLSSLSETFPYSILEGVREGCATVCSDVGGMSELIDTGENGFIFEPGDAETLAVYLTQLAQDKNLRETFAKRLFEKASSDFSLQKTKETQLNNYQKVCRKFERRKRAKDGVVICGAYGKGNAGDDAILKAIVHEMRTIDEEMPICVLSRRPKETRLINRTNAHYTFHFLGFLKAFKKARLYINGGGSLIQDVTSTRSLYYYLFTLLSAKKMGCKVIMYGCGIGPVSGKINRKNAASVMNKYVDIITLRDDNSRDELARMGVVNPSVRLSADPTLILVPSSKEKTDMILEREGIPSDGNYICFGLRHWRGLDSVINEIAEAANYAYEKYGLTPLFLPIEFPSDLEPAQMVADRLRCPYYKINTRLPIEVTIAILSRMKTVVGIRLHSLMFSAGRGVPVVGLSYDIKVDGFLKYIGTHSCIPLKETTAERLKPLIDDCVTGKMNDEVQRTAMMLTAREIENINAVRELLE